MSLKTIGKKIGHIWFYYKYFIIFGSIMALAFGFVIQDCSQKKYPDLIISISNTFPVISKRIEIEEKVKELILDLNNDGYKTVKVKPILDDQQFKMILISGNTEIMLVDKETLDELVDFGGVLKLNSYLKNNDELKTRYPEVYLENKYEGAGIYAIPARECSLFTGLSPDINRFYITLVKKKESTHKRRLKRNKNGVLFIQKIQSF